MKALLRSLGYREMTPSIWGKPFGFSLFTIELNERRIAQRFTDLKNQPCVWSSHILSEDRDEWEDEICFFENNHHGIHCSTPKSFTTQQEIVGDLLG